MAIGGGQARDLVALSVPMVGGLEQTDDPWLPFRLIDGSDDDSLLRDGSAPLVPVLVGDQRAVAAG